MELVPFVPTQLIGSADQLDRAAPDPLTSAAGQADARASPFAFAQLLQVLEALPAAGETLPQAGKDLPVTADPGGSQPGVLQLPSVAPAFVNPLTPMASLQAELGTAAAPEPSSLMPQSHAAGPIAPSTNDALWPRPQIAAVRGSDGLPVGDAAVGTSGDTVSSDDARATELISIAARNVHSAAHGTPSARELAFTAINQSASAAGPAAALASQLPSKLADDAGASSRPRLQTRNADRASVRSVAIIEPQRLESSTTTARPSTATMPVADVIAAAAPELPAGSQPGGSTLSGTPLAGSEASSAPGNNFGHTLAHTLGATSSANHAAGNTAAGALADVLGQGAAQTLDTTTPRWNEALAGRIHWMIDHDIGEARIKLNPPELGALEVRISLLDDKTYVHLTAHNAAARDELSQSLPRLRELLSMGGLDLAGATVTDGREERSGHSASGESRNLPVEFTSIAETQSVSARLISRPSTQIDLYA